jgi:hypothetical protein
MIKKSLTAIGLIGLISAGSLLAAGTASADPRPAQACNAGMVSRDMPQTWLPRSSKEKGKRVRWEQVNRWDSDRNGRLSDREVHAFQKAAVRIAGGPDCGRPLPAGQPGQFGQPGQPIRR